MHRNISFLLFFILFVITNTLPASAPAQEIPFRFDPAQPLMISAGYGHFLAVDKDGTLWAWGDNTYGQIGDGGSKRRNAPARIMTGVLEAATGLEYSLALKDDGTLWAWGRNNNGQLGNGSTEDTTSPVRIMEDVVHIAAGHHHCLALKKNGDLLCWGANAYGQVGDGTRVDRLRPQLVMTNVASIAAGSYHSFAITRHGDLYAWGRNFDGRLGDGSRTLRTRPVKIASRIRKVAAGDGHTLALKENGALLAWGGNSYGQLGDGSREKRSRPVTVMQGVSNIAAGLFHSLAEKDDGGLFAWGWNAYGQLGDGTTVDRSSPVPVNLTTGVASIAAGDFHTLALTENGTLMGWGRNDIGQLGSAAGLKESTPTRVVFSKVKTRAVGTTYVAETQPAPFVNSVGPAKKTPEPSALLVESPARPREQAEPVPPPLWKRQSPHESEKKFRVHVDTKVATREDTSVTSPIEVIDTHNILASLSLSAYPEHGKVRADIAGFSYTPDKNYAGKDKFVLVFSGKDGETIEKAIEVTVSPVDDDPVVYPVIIDNSVEQGQSESYRLYGYDVDSGNVSFVFTDAYGRETIPRTDKVSLNIKDGELKVTALPGFTGTVTLPEIQIRAKADDRISSTFISLPRTFAIRKKEEPHVIEAAGKARIKKAKPDKPVNKKIPTTGLKKAEPASAVLPCGQASIAAGTYHSLAVDHDGTLWGWGKNRHGQLGDGTTTDRTRPVKIMENVSIVAAGADHSFAVTADGTLRGWGKNRHGQLGDGTTTDRTRPVKIMENVSIVAAGADHSFAVTADGTLWGWGDNSSGQLGIPPSGDRLQPARILDDVRSITVRSYYLFGVRKHRAFVVKKNGSLWGWGDNDFGQLATGTRTKQATPVKVMDGIVDVATGASHTLALKGDGTLLTWGRRESGIRGNESIAPQIILKGVMAIKAGLQHSLILKEDGSVWGSGRNDYGQVGDGTTKTRPMPVRIR